MRSQTNSTDNDQYSDIRGLNFGIFAIKLIMYMQMMSALFMKVMMKAK